MNTMSGDTGAKPDWSTRDQQACERLGEALSKQGYVYYRSTAKEWLVADPVVMDGYRRVIVSYGFQRDQSWHERLWCSCEEGGPQGQPCVHKAAVYHEVKKPSPYRMYHEGF